MKRHSIDVFSLVSGLIVIGTAAVLLAPDPDVTALVRYSPLGIIAIGVALLFSTRTRGGDAEPAEAGSGQPAAASHVDDMPTVTGDDSYDERWARTDVDRLDDDLPRDPLSEDADRTRPFPRAD